MPSRRGRVVVLAATAVLIASLLHAGAGVTRAADSRDVNSLGLAASYDVDATFDWRGRTADVKTTATVRGSKPWSSSELAFNLQVLRIGRADVKAVTIDGRPVTPFIDDQTIIVPLDPPLSAGGSTVVGIDYTARMTATPNPDGDNWGFAATNDYLTAYRWIPWLSRTTRFDRPSVGDPYVTAVADSVHVAITADDALTFATTGVQTSKSGTTRVFDAREVRDFNFAASPTYRTASRTVRGTKVTVYYDKLDAQLMLDVTARAINDYTDKVGADPYPVLNIAETGPWASIESPETFWVADNVPGHLLAWTTAHEVAHEWFYAVVGNDQAREPFADEALVDFMARNLLDRFVPSQCPTNFLDKTVYNIAECYPWVVYVQGNLWLRDYRASVGAAAFWRGVADYFREYKFGIGGTRQLLDALDRAAGKVELHKRFPRLYPLPVSCLPFGAVLGIQ